MRRTEGLVSGAGRAAAVGGVLGLASLVTVFAGEIVQGEDFMGTAGSQLAGWAGFLACALLAVGLMGVAARYGAALSGSGRVALLLLGLATAIMVGASATLALVVPTLADKAPELVSDPPAAVPPAFILSGLVMGICALVVAVGLRRTGAAPKAATTLMILGAVVTMVPLPSRYFLLAFAVGLLALAPTPSGEVVAEPERERTA